MTRPTILAFSSWFLPGFKAGGPIRTLVNIIQHLEEDFCFKVVTRDRDLGDDAPFVGTESNKWSMVGATAVKYIGQADRSFLVIRNTILESRPDVIYLNSFFDPQFSVFPMLLRWAGLVPGKIPMIIAPRGELALPALAIKARRKSYFLLFARLSGLCDRVIWQAGSVHEERDIRAIWGEKAQVVIAPDLPPRLEPSGRVVNSRCKTVGVLRAVFLSRLAPIKNLNGALNILKSVKVTVDFDIYGPLEDENYWNKCQETISTLPSNITVRYLGPVANSTVADVFSQYDLLFLPTLGESFGHVILEAMLASCPVLISDQTPWQVLEERNAGWVVPLDNPERHQEILQRVASMDADEYLIWSQGACRCGTEFSNDEALVEISNNLFRHAIAK